MPYSNIYTDRSTERSSEKDFLYNSVIGIMLDRENGYINFFKDGKDLGQAFKLTDNQN